MSTLRMRVCLSVRLSVAGQNEHQLENLRTDFRDLYIFGLIRVWSSKLVSNNFEFKGRTKHHPRLPLLSSLPLFPLNSSHSSNPLPTSTTLHSTPSPLTTPHHRYLSNHRRGCSRAGPGRHVLCQAAVVASR